MVGKGLTSEGILFLSDAGADHVRAAYTPAVWERLVALKRRYDPDNLFRMNQNIQP